MDLDGKKVIFYFGIIVFIIAFMFVLGGSSTTIINTANLSKLFDTNTVGGKGEIPFINLDGNALETQQGFDFNKDTNTLNVENVVADKVGVNTVPSYPFHVVLDANDTKAFYINGDSNPASASNGSGYLVDITRTRNNVDYGSAQFPTAPSDLGISNIITQSGTTSSTYDGTMGIWGKTTSGMQNQVQSNLNPTENTQFGGTEAMYGILNTISKSGTFQPTDDFTIGSNLNLYGMYNTINNGTLDVASTKVTISEYGIYNTLSGTTNVGATPALIRRQYATYNIANAAVNSPTAAGVTIERTAGYFSTNQIGGTNKGVEARAENQQATNYGVYTYVANGNTNWSFYNSTSANNFLGRDNSKTFFGDNNKSSISNNGTDLVIDPKENTSGKVKILSGLEIYPTIQSAEKLNNGTFTGNANYWTLTTGWAYNTNLVRKSSNGTGTLSQSDINMVTPVQADKIYTLSYVISSRTAGSVTPSVGGVTLTTRSANGTYTETFRSVDANILRFTPTDTARFYIDTISLKEWTGDGNLYVNGYTALGKSVATERLDVSGNIKTDTNIYASGYMHATDFITGSLVADITDGKTALDKLNNIDEWLKTDSKGDKIIDYSKHYANVNYSQNEIIGYNISFKDVEECYDKIETVTKLVDCDYKGENCKEELVPETKKICTTITKQINEPIFSNVTKQGLSMETRVAEMEKMIYELSEKNKDLEFSLCTKDLLCVSKLGIEFVIKAITGK